MKNKKSVFLIASCFVVSFLSCLLIIICCALSVGLPVNRILLCVIHCTPHHLVDGRSRPPFLPWGLWRWGGGGPRRGGWGGGGSSRDCGVYQGTGGGLGGSWGGWIGIQVGTHNGTNVQKRLRTVSMSPHVQPHMHIPPPGVCCLVISTHPSRHDCSHTVAVHPPQRATQCPQWQQEH